MATKTAAGINTTTGFSGFTQGVVNRIEAEAYKMLYDNTLLAGLCKSVGKGAKGSAMIYPYFDPSTFATAASALTEANDFVNYTALTNASVIIVASELGITSFVTDILKESQNVDIPAEIARQQGIACAVGLEKHILGKLSAGLTTGTITGTNSTNGFTFAKYAAAKTLLDAAALTVPGRKHAVIPTYSWTYTTTGLLNSTSPTSIFNVNGPIGDGVASKFYLSTIFGDVDIYGLGVAYITASTTAAGYMFVTDGVALWKPRDYRLERERDASARGDEIVSTFRAGAKVLHTGYCKRLKMYASAPS